MKNRTEFNFGFNAFFAFFLYSPFYLYLVKMEIGGTKKTKKKTK